MRIMTIARSVRITATVRITNESGTNDGVSYFKEGNVTVKVVP